MLEHTRGRAALIARGPKVLDELTSAITRFFAGDISKQQFIEMSGAERATLAGAVAGNFAMHHPAEAFEILKSLNEKV